jgi:2'-5' RNA ligase
MGYFPDVDLQAVDLLRRKYDPTVDLVGPHVTVLFPVPERVGEEPLVRHLESVLRRWQPFPIRMHGLQKSWDHWLFLVLKDGNHAVIELYQEVYTGMLAKYRRDDIVFIPHVALGLFVKQSADYDFKNPQSLAFDEQRYEEALREAEASKLDYRCVIDKLHLTKLTEDFSRVVWSKPLPLGAAGA